MRCGTEAPRGSRNPPQAVSTASGAHRAARLAGQRTVPYCYSLQNRIVLHESYSTVLLGSYSAYRTDDLTQSTDDLALSTLVFAVAGVMHHDIYMHFAPCHAPAWHAHHHVTTDSTKRKLAKLRPPTQWPGWRSAAPSESEQAPVEGALAAQAQCTLVRVTESAKRVGNRVDDPRQVLHEPCSKPPCWRSSSSAQCTSVVQPKLKHSYYLTSA